MPLLVSLSDDSVSGFFGGNIGFTFIGGNIHKRLFDSIFFSTLEMSKNAADSLQNFSLKKKKFSFSKQNENVSEPSSDSGEDFVPKLKGSAKLKKRYSSSSESESEDENPKDLK